MCIDKFADVSLRVPTIIIALFFFAVNFCNNFSRNELLTYLNMTINRAGTLLWFMMLNVFVLQKNYCLSHFFQNSAILIYLHSDHFNGHFIHLIVTSI